MKRGVIYDSIPPQVKGSILGNITLRFPGIIFQDKRKVNLTGYRVEFNWWGDSNDIPVSLTIPWKPGQIIDEAVFPLVVGPSALQGYFSDMGDELHVRVIKDGIILGRSHIPLQGRIASEPFFMGEVPVIVSNTSDQCRLQVELKINFDDLQDNLKIASGMTKVLQRKGKNGTMISTFERMEALVTTDNSKQYTEWPDRQTKSSGRIELYHDKKQPAAASLNLIQQYKVSDSDREASQARLRGLAEYAKHKEESGPRQEGASLLSPPGGVHVGNSTREVGSAHSQLDTVTASSSVRSTFSKDQRRIPRDDEFHTSEVSLPESSHWHHDSHKGHGAIDPDKNNKILSNKILSRAESLLSKVKQSTATLINSKGDLSISRPSTAFEQAEPNSNFPTFASNADHLSSQIKSRLLSNMIPSSSGYALDRGGVKGDELAWLLRGVPEVYDDDVVVEDEVVERLIKQGGNPPSQISFPSLYATSQKTLLNLGNAKILSLTFTELNVYSARFGLRKEATFFVIRCPAGCTVEAAATENHTIVNGDDAQVVAVDLTENDPWRQINTAKQKNVLKDFFVGSKVLDLSVKWNISISDDLISDWLSSSSSANSPPISSMIHIDVYSYLLPPTASKQSATGAANGTSQKKRGWSSSTILLGTTDISIQVLLGSPSLSSFVSAEISLDATSQSTVADRLRRLPNYSQLGNKNNPASLKNLGNLKCKLSLLDACSRPLVPPAERGIAPAAPSSTVAMGQSENSVPRRAASTDGPLRTIIDDALDFIPQEASRPNNHEDAQNTSRMNSSVSVGIAVHSLTRHNWSGHWMTSIPKRAVMKLLVSYKIALSHESVRDSMEVVMSSQHLLTKEHIDISGGHLHQLSDIMSWRFIYFEVWLVWREEKFLDETRKLLGLAKYPVGADLGEAVSLAVIDPSSGSLTGHLRVTLLFNDSRTTTQTLLKKCLTTEHVRSVLLRDFQEPGHEQVQEVVDDGALSEEDGSMSILPRPHLIPTPQPEYDSGKLHHSIGRDDIAEEKHPSNKNKITPTFSNSEPDAGIRNTTRTGFHVAASSATESLQISCDSLLGEVNKVKDSTPVHVDVLSSMRCEEYKEADVKHEVNVVLPVRESAQVDDATGVEKLFTHHGDVQHVLDFSIIGGFGDVASVISRHFPLMKDSLGCYICYSFPGLEDTSLERWNAIRIIRGGKFANFMSVWWDRDCSILNSRNRHEFRVPYGDSCSSALGCEGLSDIEFLVVPSDMEGNMPSNPTSIAKFSLPVKVLETITGRAGFTQTLSLPLHFVGVNTDDDVDIKLCVSHRILPASILLSQEFRKSFEISALANESKQLDSAHDKIRTSRDAPQRLSVQHDREKSEAELTITVDQIACLSSVHENLHDGRKVYVSCSSSSTSPAHSLKPSSTVELFQTSVKMLQDFAHDASNVDVHTVDIPSEHLALASPEVSVHGKHAFHELRPVTLLFTLHALPDWGSHSVEKSHAGSMFGDEVVGTSVVSLCPLALGYPSVSGWYYVTNSAGTRMGQIKVTIAPCQMFEDDIRPPPDTDDVVIDETTSDNVADNVLRSNHKSLNGHINSKLSLNLQDMMAELEATRLSILGFNLTNEEGAGGKERPVHITFDENEDEDEDLEDAEYNSRYSSEFERDDSFHSSVATDVDHADLTYSLLQPSPCSFLEDKNDDTDDKTSLFGEEEEEEEEESARSSDNLSFSLMKPSPESKLERSFFSSDNESSFASQAKKVPFVDIEYDISFNGSLSQVVGSDDEFIDVKADDEGLETTVSHDEHDAKHGQEYVLPPVTSDEVWVMATCCDSVLEDNIEDPEGKSSVVQVPQLLLFEEFLLEIRPDTHDFFEEYFLVSERKSTDESKETCDRDDKKGEEPMVNVDAYVPPITPLTVNFIGDKLPKVQFEEDMESIEDDSYSEHEEKHDEVREEVDILEKEEEKEGGEAEKKQDECGKHGQGELAKKQDLADKLLSSGSDDEDEFEDGGKGDETMEDLPPPRTTPAVPPSGLPQLRPWRDFHEQEPAPILSCNREQVSGLDQEISSPGLCVCPKCVKRPPARLDEIMSSHQVSKSQFRVKEEKPQRPSYEENVRNDVFEVSRIIQSAMAASGMKALPASTSLSWQRPGLVRRQFSPPLSHLDSSSNDDWNDSRQQDGQDHGRRPRTLRIVGKSRKNFMDAETDRVSRIMLGSMMKYSATS